MKQFLSGLADIANVTIPSISRDLSPVTLFINQLSACYEWAEKRKADIEIVSKHVLIYAVIHIILFRVEMS